MIPIIANNFHAIAELCRAHGVYKLDLFGSAATGAFDPATSDIDFVVSFWDRSPGYANRYLDLAEALEALLGRDVDLVTEASLQSPYIRNRIDAQRENVFENRNREAAARRADRLQGVGSRSRHRDDRSPECEGTRHDRPESDVGARPANA